MKTPPTTALEMSLYCPITGELMKDPVVDPEGNSYEKEAILSWLARKGTSPITREPLHRDQLTPNRALQDILAARLRNGVDLLDSEAGPMDQTEDFPQPQPDLKITLDATYNEDGLALIQVAASDDATTAHSPNSVVCVIDVSYSMDSPATMYDDSEGAAGLSLLDIVKHAGRTVIETLGPQDQLSVVAYADCARVVFPFMPMTPENRATAWTKVEALQTCGSTNLYDGLLKAMDLVRQGNAEKPSILLLTDGLPNIHPPRGTLPSLRRYKETHPEMKCTISTFGFGYSLDSVLLHDIAVEGGGHYGFIPDSSFVGTTFVNATANILATALPKCHLSLEPCNGALIQECLSGQQSTVASWGLSVALPALLYGQTQDVLLKLDLDQCDDFPLKATLQIEDADTNPFDSALETDASLSVVGSSGDARLKAAQARCMIVKFVKDSESRFPKYRDNAKEQVALEAAQSDHAETLVAVSSFLDSVEHKGLRALVEDMTGQIEEAYARNEWHHRWGRHYLLSLARAHQLQQCTNFKDPGLQVYATEKFTLIRDTADDTFCNLPPPKPSLSRGSTPARPVTTMRVYHNANAPCFAAGKLKMADGSEVSVDAVRAGDSVMSLDGDAAIILCVVVTECEGGTANLVSLPGGVLVTPWHPVRAIGTTKWRFPVDLAESQIQECNCVYSFVLEGMAPTMLIGSFEAVSLGHGVVGDPVAEHAYLGTERVIHDLSKMVGWDAGRVHLAPNPAVRHPETGLIVAFKQAPTGTGPTSTRETALPPRVVAPVSCE